jgi:transposase
VLTLIRGREVEEIEQLKQQGLSIKAISQLTGWDRKTIRKYLVQPVAVPVYGPRQPRASKLDGFKPYLEERLQAGVWNGRVLLRELRGRGYGGGYTILTDWLRPQREAARVVAVRRFETPAGRQGQVDWGQLGTIDMDGQPRKLWAFTFTLGYSRALMAEATLDQKLGTLLRMHEEAFRQLGGVPEEILYDRMKTVWLKTDERGEIVWHPVFWDLAGYWGFRPRLCRPYRAQTKGKIESGVKYVRRKLRLQPIGGRSPYGYLDEELRKVARDAYVSWQANRYSVPWTYAGCPVWVRDRQDQVEVHSGGQRVAVHRRAAGQHQTITLPEHHQGIPLGAQRPPGKILIHVQPTAPVVEVRPLAAYESVVAGGEHDSY